MVRDLSIPVKIIRGQLVRESDGLAMSSRNSRLSSEGRHQALALYDILSECKNLLQSNLTDVSAIKQKAIQNVSKKYPGFTLEYLHIIDETTLLPANSITESNNLRGVIAGYIEGVRLIDTLRLAD
jgi:pantoate--beta-alanine ligase